MKMKAVQWRRYSFLARVSSETAYGLKSSSTSLTVHKEKKNPWSSGKKVKGNSTIFFNSRISHPALIVRYELDNSPLYKK